MGKVRTSEQQIEQTQRRAQALALRRQRLTYQQIGDQMGISGPAAFKLVSRAMDRYAKVSAENAAALREESREDLEYLRGQLEPLIQQGDPRGVAEAIKINARLASLYGLDAPKKNEHTGKDGAPMAFSFADIFAAAATDEPEQAHAPETILPDETPEETQ